MEKVGSATLFADQPPATQSDQYSLKQSLVMQNEGFVLRSTSRDPCSYGLATPTDELTGLPLPIVISPPIDRNANEGFVDYHHSFHPERDLIYGDDAALALRRSRGQNLPRWLHEHYHKYFAGPEFPQAREQIFTIVVLACSGVIPDQAIDFEGGKGGPKIIDVSSRADKQILTLSVRHEAAKRKRYQSFYQAQIGMFFANYAIEQSIEEVVNQRVIDEFLDTKVTNRRIQLGNLLLREGVKMSIEPVVPVHEEVKRRGLVIGKQTDLYARVNDFFVRNRRKDYHIALERKWRPIDQSSVA